jgi:hypothetical protein
VTAYKFEELRVEVRSLEEVYLAEICIDTKLRTMRHASQHFRTGQIEGEDEQSEVRSSSPDGTRECIKDGLMDTRYSLTYTGSLKGVITHLGHVLS